MEFSKSTVSELCKKLNLIVNTWNSRPLSDSRFPFVIVDALYLKVREEGRVKSRGGMIAAGIKESGHWEALGLMLGTTEAEESWTDFFVFLKNRGLRGMELLVPNNHSGLVRAGKKQFLGVTWQRCQTHFVRNVPGLPPKICVWKFIKK